MANYVLIHGAGDVGWAWHLVAAELEVAGHTVIAPDLPCEDESASLSDNADAVLATVGEREPLIVVAHSFGGFVAPIVASRRPTSLLVFVAAMIPRPGESGAAFFSALDASAAAEPQDEAAEMDVFYHDVPPDVADEGRKRGRGQAERPFAEPWPLPAWPDVPVRSVIGTLERLFPAPWLRRVNEDRVGFTPDELDAGHYIPLAKPVELAALLERYRLEVGA